MIRYRASEKYYRNLKKLLEESPELGEEIERCIGWFSKNPDDTRLVNHRLRKRMQGRWAFSITGDIRIVYRWIGKNEVRFLAIGGHKKVYGEIG